jgi:hypothetical protein
MNKAPRLINTPPFPAVPNRERNSIDSRAKSAEDKTMETSIPKPAADLEALTNDLALIKVNLATRSDVATAKADSPSKLPRQKTGSESKPKTPKSS